MRIADLRVTPVAFTDPPLRNSWGVHAPEAHRLILQLDTDAGITGLGELPGSASLHRELLRVRPLILGEDVFHLERLRLIIGNPRVFAGVEVACLDAAGRQLGRPVSDLLGGAVRDRVEFAAYLFYKYAGDDPWGEVNTPEAMLRLAQAWAARFGFTAFKIKGGVLPPDEEIETVRRLREHFGPRAQIRLDPNAIWSPQTAARAARQLREYDLEYLEDPAPDIVGMAQVKRAAPDMPLATNMCVTQFEHFAPAVQAGAVDVILSDHHFWGGLTGNKRLAQVCETFRLGVGMHSNSHLGISLAAMLHSAATTPNMIYACDTHYPWIVADEDIIEEPFMDLFKGGALPVPTGPGLGVTLNEDKLAALAARAQARAQVERDDTAEARKRDARYLPFKPRW